MTVLLDTHALVWWLEDSPRLSPRATAIIGDPSNRILVSAASGWELAIKVALGKIDLAVPLRELTPMIARHSFAELAITLEHGVRAGELPPHHHDPFDRLLIAQAQTLEVAIISADAVLDRYNVARLW